MHGQLIESCPHLRFRWVRRETLFAKNIQFDGMNHNTVKNTEKV